VWNEFDFSQPHIGESTPNMNKKGLLTFDRKPKDVYYLYKANWNPAPMVYVASRDWAHRAGVDSTGTRTVTQPVDVYSNAGPVELVVNGKIDVSVFPGSYVSFHDVGLKGGGAGEPALSVDVLTANLRLLPLLLRRFPDLTLAGEPLRRNRLVLRGYESLPISWT